MMRRCMRRGAARMLLAVACACAALLRAHGVDLAHAALPNGSFRRGEDTLGTVRDDAAPVPSVHGMYSRPKLQRRVRQVTGATAKIEQCDYRCDSPTCIRACDKGCNEECDGFVAGGCNNGCDRSCDQRKCITTNDLNPCNHSCDCPVCSAGQYLFGSSCSGRGSQKLKTCQPCRNWNINCEAGKYQSGTCGGTSNSNSLYCSRCKSCYLDQYRIGTCSGTTDSYECIQCSNTTCATGEYRSGSCSSTTKGFQCSTQPSCAAEQYLKGSSPTARGICATCSNIACKTGTEYRSGSCSGTTNGYTCEPQPTCTSKQYLSGASVTAKGTCVDQPTCGSGKWCPACARQRVCVRIVYFACAAFCLCFIWNSKCIQPKGASTCDMVYAQVW